MATDNIETGELMYRLHNPFRDGIDTMNISFAAATLRDVRQALEHGAKFRSELARDVIGHALGEAETIRKLLKEAN